ncbi:MAG: rare lipoprotein [Chloroflexota bacterium]|nr:rare lipoprotein [Chloroflexota bacterium]
MPSYLARTGLAVFAILFGLTLITERPAADRGRSGPVSAAGHTIDLPALREIAPVITLATSVAGVETAALTVAVPPATPMAVAPAAAPVQVARPAPSSFESDSIVLASWYGPGFYGNRTACGQLYTPEILGVAHLTLPCGTTLALTYRGRTVTVPVIDRGPYIAGRTIDLSHATKLALGCTDLCTLRMQVGR